MRQLQAERQEADRRRRAERYAEDEDDDDAVPWQPVDHTAASDLAAQNAEARRVAAASRLRRAEEGPEAFDGFRRVDLAPNLAEQQRRYRATALVQNEQRVIRRPSSDPLHLDNMSDAQFLEMLRGDPKYDTEDEMQAEVIRRRAMLERGLSYFHEQAGRGADYRTDVESDSDDDPMNVAG